MEFSQFLWFSQFCSCDHYRNAKMPTIVIVAWIYSIFEGESNGIRGTTQRPKVPELHWVFTIWFTLWLENMLLAKVAASVMSLYVRDSDFHEKSYATYRFELQLKVRELQPVFTFRQFSQFVSVASQSTSLRQIDLQMYGPTRFFMASRMQFIAWACDEKVQRYSEFSQFLRFSQFCMVNYHSGSCMLVIVIMTWLYSIL